VLFVALLAFLLAAFPARNSDLWRHLASGRALLTEGDFTALSFTWLFDVACYALYATVGGTGLAAAKALLAAALAVLLLRLCRASGGWGVPAFSAVLALLALSPRLTLQPVLVSLFSLTLTLCFLHNKRPDPSDDRFPWPLLPLFAAWANCDRWFVVGLAVVALAWLGRTLDEGPRLPAVLRRALWLVALIGAGLLNPHGLRAFPAPAGLLLPLAKPFQAAYFASAVWDPAGVAYFALLALSLLSFLLIGRGLSLERFLPWCALAVLSALQVRFIPFFVLAAAPALALNLQQYAASRVARLGEPHPRGEPGLLAVAAALVLLVCAWPGWLQGPPFGPRRLAVEPSQALVRGAETVRRWQKEKKLAPARGLHLSRDSSSAFAWFSPEVGSAYNEPLARALRGEEGAPADWADLMHAAGVNHVVLHDPDPGRLFAAGERFFADPQQWPLLHLEGNLAIFGWRDPKNPSTSKDFRNLELDLNRLAFGEQEVRRAPATTAPDAARPGRWWDSFWRPAPASPIDRGEATLHYLHAEAVLRQYLLRRRAAWDVSQAVGLVGAAGARALPGGALDVHVRLVFLLAPLPREGAGQESPLERLALGLHGPFSEQRDDVPPALLFLAIRAARRAVAENPTDAHAYFVLGESYLRLLQGTRERARANRLTELLQLRQAQASGALNQAIRLNPRYALAHLSLGRFYQSIGYLDLALKHLGEFVRLSPNDEPPAGLSELARAVREQEEAYAAESKDLRSLQQRASSAMKRGLAGRARDMLEESNIAAFGTQGMALELELFVRTGRLREVREWTEPEQKASLGENNYHMLRIQAHAAAGDYAEAQEECFELVKSLAVGGGGEEQTPIRHLMAMLVTQAVIDGQPSAGLMTGLFRHSIRRTDLRKRVAVLARTLRYETDLQVLRGLLALEEGDVKTARDAFTAALAVWGGDEAVAAGAGIDFNGRPLAQDYLGLLDPAEGAAPGRNATSPR
jgi:tetratricopeptide (TPR) repeat protein